MQIARERFYKCVEIARSHNGRGVIIRHGNTGKKKAVKAYNAKLECTAFLVYYTNTFCQKSGGDYLLWPQGRTMTDIHSRDFKKWLLIQQGKPPGAEPFPWPCLTTFLSAVSDPRFKRVKRRKENFHTRCDMYFF